MPAAAGSFLTPRLGRTAFLIACASSRMTSDQRNLRQPFLPPHETVGRDDQIERGKFVSGIRGDAREIARRRIPSDGRRMTCSDGPNRANSCRQLPNSDAGTINRLGASVLDVLLPVTGIRLRCSSRSIT